MRYLSILLSLICMMFTAVSAHAERRVAFVVGNGAYKNVAQLPNPPVDAKAMASVLRNVGFDVVEDVRSLLDHESRVAKVNLPQDRHVRRRAGKIFIE